jgi:hypothetical protein
VGETIKEAETMNRRVFRGAGAVAIATLALAAWAAPAGATPAPRLLAEYEPLTYFHPAESFLPTKVQSFVADSDLEQLVGGTWVVADPDPEPGSLPAAGGASWRLNQTACSPAAALGGLACYGPASNQGSGGPAVYGRVAHDGDRIVLQYWYFYYDDVYSYPFAPAGSLWQAHEGDWEVVNVVLSADEQPLSVAYSQHCLGQQRQWADTTRLSDTHPVVYVALGSHANYFEPGVHQFNSACVPLQVQGLLRSFGLPQPADVTSAEGPTAGPNVGDAAVMPVHQIDEDSPSWMSFPGTWGEQQFLHAPSPIGTVPFGTSPQGPEFHDVWAHPLATIAGWPAG